MCVCFVLSSNVWLFFFTFRLIVLHNQFAVFRHRTVHVLPPGSGARGEARQTRLSVHGASIRHVSRVFFLFCRKRHRRFQTRKKINITALGFGVLRTVPASVRNRTRAEPTDQAKQCRPVQTHVLRSILTPPAHPVTPTRVVPSARTRSAHICLIRDADASVQDLQICLDL